MHPVRKQVEKELEDLKRRINEELSALKQSKFANVSDRDFEDMTGVSRASIPGVELGTSWPQLDTIYLWVTSCGSSLQELFRAPSGEFADSTKPIHRHLEYVLRSKGPTHWLAQAIESEYSQLRPPERKIPKIRGSPSPARGEEVGHAAEGNRDRAKESHMRAKKRPA